MGSKSLGTLTLDLVARTAGFTAGLSKSERESAAWKKKVASNAMGAGTAIAAGAVAAAGGLALIVNSQREVIDQQLITAQSLDTTYASLANLERAADLGGVAFETIEKASGKLALNLGKAIQGSKAQSEAFQRLGLDAQALYEIPLDQRISAINKALQENVQASERAAVAADIYGAKNAIAMQMLDPDTIAEAAKQAELFGLNLSDIDATKVESANDAISVFGAATSGAAKQLTVQLAPALQAAGDAFLEYAEKSGGLGNVVEESVNKAVDAVAFLINAADGADRAFSLAADSIIVSWNAIAFGASSALSVIFRGLDSIPGIDFSGAISDLEEFSQQAKGVIGVAVDEMGEKINEPLAGDSFKKFWSDAQKSAEDSAAASVLARQEAKKTGEAFDDEAEERDKAAEKAAKAAQKAAEAIDDEITALERAAKTWGMSADEVKIYDLTVQGANESQIQHAQALLDTVAGLEAQKKATEEYEKIVEGLRTEEESRVQALRDQLAAIEAVNDASSGDTRDRAIDAAFSEAPDSGVGEIASGPFSDLFNVNEAEKELEDWYASQMSMLNTFRQERSDLSAEWDAKELELKKQHEDAMKQLEMARWQSVLSGVSDILGDMIAAQDTDSKKGKERAKKLAIVQATINAYTAATGAWASASAIPVVGWVMGPIAAAAAFAAGMANVNAIKGQAHAGIDSVPSTGTWILEKGERVTTSATSAKLDATLERVQSSMNGVSVSRGSGKSVTVNQTINTQGPVDSRTSNQIARDTSRKQRIAQARFG